MTNLEKAKEQYKDNLRELDSRTLYDDIDVDSARMVAFKAGAEWQSKQSPWINVEERVPDEGQEVFVLIMSDGIPHIRKERFYRNPYIDQCAKWIHGNSRVLSWMPIPSFESILESNKDVLKRIKEKGD